MKSKEDFCKVCIHCDGVLYSNRENDTEYACSLQSLHRNINENCDFDPELQDEPDFYTSRKEARKEHSLVWGLVFGQYVSSRENRSDVAAWIADEAVSRMVKP